jgi:hypothetical protein
VKTTTKFKIWGWLVTVIGVTFFLVGVMNTFGNMNVSGPPPHFWLAFIGLPLSGVGAMLLRIGYRPEITKIGAGIHSETMDYAGTEFGKAAGKTVTALEPAIKKTAEVIRGNLKPEADIEAELKKIDGLRARGIITEEEYRKMRAKILEL